MDLSAPMPVDQSNVNLGKIVLLPKKPDESAKKIRDKIRESFRAEVAVIVSDTFAGLKGGQVDMAVGPLGNRTFQRLQRKN